jgi:hypothetical protein
MRKGVEWVRFSFPDARTDGDVLHPFLAPAAALAHLWAGREALHGGAFASPAGAVALLADKEGGKSTSLAWLATEHCVPVLADDLVVVTQGAVLAGPRCLDLRPTSLLKPPLRARVRRMRKRDRLRLTLAPAPGEVPLAAIVVLRFGQRVTLRQVPPLERLGLLLPNRMFTDLVPGNPATILDMATLPMLVLTRPRGGAGLRIGAQALVDYFS